MTSTPIKVLLVDDDEDDYILTRDWFNEFQTTEFELTWVDSYQAARDAITNNEYDIYLVDYRLGVSSGLELLHEAQGIGFSRPIILLTGKGDKVIDIKAMKAGAADYLEKSQLSAPLLERSIRYAIERKQTEQKIREQAALLDVATDAIFVCDLENRILFWNKAAEKLYGCTKATVLGQKTGQIWQDDNYQQHQTALNILIKNGSWEGEIYQTTKFGKSIVVESRWTLVEEFDRSSECILVVNTDITQKKQLESQFLRAQRLESIGTLASGIAHDLNNVLAPILMSAQLLESQLKDERSQRLTSILINNTKRGADLVKQVLSFTRGVEGELSIISLKHSIREIQQVIKETFPKTIEVSTFIPNNLWTVKSDPTQLHQVLMNLCVNARDAMFNGGRLTIRAENITVDESYAQMHLDAQVGSYVLIGVIDTGIGIPQEILDRIFEPFFTTKEIGKGTGLGLSTVLGIVKSHSGFINVSSEPGKGSEFKIYLPAYQTQENSVDQNLEFPIGNGELILVVDDEDSIRDVTKASLENYNYQTIAAKDGIEAIALYAEYRDKIFLVLTDMVMPSMDGLTTIRTLKKINPEVKIIAVSGFASTDKINAANNIGVHAFLPKPYTAKQLLQTIGTVKSD
ncbi:MAG: response regulator [Cyanobacteria bacterium P01_A01_bin.84]